MSPARRLAHFMPPCLKLMSVAHIKSKVYFDEICTRFYSDFALDECSFMLYTALNKYETSEERVTPQDFGIVDRGDPKLFFADLLDGVEFEIRSLSRKTIVGHFLEVAACTNSEESQCVEMETKLNQGLQVINDLVKSRMRRSRVKRCAWCGAKLCEQDGSYQFRARHTNEQHPHGISRPSYGPGATLPPGKPNTYFHEHTPFDGTPQVVQQQYRDHRGHRNGFFSLEEAEIHPVMGTDPSNQHQVIHTHLNFLNNPHGHGYDPSLDSSGGFAGKK